MTKIIDEFLNATPNSYYLVAAKESGKIKLMLGEYITKEGAAQRKRECDPLFATHVDVEVIEIFY